MRHTGFTSNMLLMFAGPIVWALHFLVIYGFTGILCARPASGFKIAGSDLLYWGIILAGLIAIASIAAIYVRGRPRHVAEANRDFIQWMSAALSAAAVIAIIWETLPVLLVPACL